MKIVVFQMIYDHEINWASAYTNNLDNGISRSVQNGQLIDENLPF